MKQPKKKRKPKFFLIFSNEEIEFFVPVSYVWTGDGFNDLHVQFDGPADDNYEIGRCKCGVFAGLFEIVALHGKVEQVYCCKTMSISAIRPTKGRKLDPAILKNTWYLL